MQNAMKDSPSTVSKPAPVSLLRRLGAIFYDSIVLFCIVFLAWQPVPLIPDDNWPEFLSQIIRVFYLLLICYLFFGWFWTHGGQTLGMRAWRIKLVDMDSGQSVDWRQSLIRFAIALISWGIAGLGFLASLIHSRKHTWHDRASNSELKRVLEE